MLILPRVRSVIDPVLQAYLDDSATKQSRGKRDATELDAGFRAFAISQVRLFLFVGHDSMSSTIYYTLHLLSSKPKHLVVPDSVRARHRTGKRYFRFSSITPGGATPQLLGSLPYSTAVIKEAAPAFFPARFR